MATVASISKFLTQVVHLPSFPIFCLYLLMVSFSRVWQRFTKPLGLRWILVVYNFACSLISLYTLIAFVYGIYRADFVYQKAATPELQHVFYLYWLTKNLELLDTVFMILRHRQRQISFLHVYHHASMVILSDYSYRFAAWPAIAVILGLNSMVHVFLYFYYGLTAYDSNQTPVWKQRLTELQIIQFFLDMIYAAKGYTSHGFCIYGFFYGFGMIYLFSNFYYHAYLRPKRKKDASVYINGKTD